MKLVTDNPRIIQTARWLVPTLLAGLLAISCASTQQKEMAPTDRVFTGVHDPQMQMVWKKAEAEGKLPPIAEIPTPKERVSQREPAVIREPKITIRRPLISETTVADAQPFSLKRLERYEGIFEVTQHEPGLLIGRLQQRADLLELYYKIPGERNRIAIVERAKLQLSFRDEVVDSALQRSIVLSTDKGTTPFVYVAEGSNEPYRKTLKQISLAIEQQGKSGNPPVKITYRGQSVTLKQGERRKIGAGESAAEVYLLRSVAIRPQQALLQEGQPFYVTIMMYRAQ